DGVPHFINTDNFWAEPGFTRESLNEVNKQMVSNNWHDVLSKRTALIDNSVYQFIADLTRARWDELVSVPQNGSILDLGAGMGTISQALSKRFKVVYAVEPVKE